MEGEPEVKLRKYRSQYLRFINRKRGGAILMEPNLTELKDNTPESFYHYELGFKSTLEDRFVAHGGRFKGHE